MDKNQKIGIVGLGLIGGSIFKALCALRCDVTAVSKTRSTIEKAHYYASKVSKDLNTVKDCDIIFVCTPINKTKKVLSQLNKIIPETTIVTDASSIKGFVVKKQYNFKFIPSHPMAGTENRGFEASYESLFDGAKWVFTSFEKTNENDLKKLTDIVVALGATPVFTTAKEHDKAVALISHMPMLFAQALFKTASKNKLAMKLASSGFRDMTRLAMSNPEMAQDMIDINKDNIIDALEAVRQTCDELIEENYRTQIEPIIEQRREMYDNKGKNTL